MSHRDIDPGNMPGASTPPPPAPQQPMDPKVPPSRSVGGWLAMELPDEPKQQEWWCSKCKVSVPESEMLGVGPQLREHTKCNYAVTRRPIPQQQEWPQTWKHRSGNSVWFESQTEFDETMRKHGGVAAWTRVLPGPVISQPQQQAQAGEAQSCYCDRNTLKCPNCYGHGQTNPKDAEIRTLRSKLEQSEREKFAAQDECHRLLRPLDRERVMSQLRWLSKNPTMSGTVTVSQAGVSDITREVEAVFVQRDHYRTTLEDIATASNTSHLADMAAAALARGEGSNAQ